MRLKVIMEAGEKIKLPIHHNHMIQATLYSLIQQYALRHFLHNSGFRYGKRSFKLFTFSRIESSFYISKDKEEILFQSPIALTFCSPFKMLVEEIANGLLGSREIKLGDQVLSVSKVLISDPRVLEGHLVARMLSPLVVYSTLHDKEKGSFTYYYSPLESRFSELVRNNLIKKFRIVYGDNPECHEFDISPFKLAKNDFKILFFKKTIVKGWMGTFELRGDPLLLELGLHAGLGSKNSEGFGCCIEEMEDKKCF